jgi:hypothetical protein
MKRKRKRKKKEEGVLITKNYTYSIRRIIFWRKRDILLIN